jgi:hypothetical protein
MENSHMVNNLKFQNTYLESLVNLTKFRINNKTQHDKITTFSFIMRVYDLYRRVLGLREYQFSTQVLNASRDYYAMVKNTKARIGDDKLKSLLVNTRALVEHLREKDADSELVQLHIKEANLYIEDAQKVLKDADLKNKCNVGAYRLIKKAEANIKAAEKGKFGVGHINDL